MALTSEAIATALALDYGTNKAAVDAMRDRIAAHLGRLALPPMLLGSAETQVKEELKELQSNIKFGLESKPTTEKEWCDQVDVCLARVGMGLERGRKLEASLDDDRDEADRALEEQQLKEAARMDRDSAIKLEEFSMGAPVGKVTEVDMGDVRAARLGKTDAVATDSLSTCAGVSLFDPVTKVGAVMHVYDGTKKPTLQEALVKMKTIDSSVDPTRLQVTLMPGSFKGGDQSHLEGLRKQLSEAGITQVRDFAKEGRTSSTLQIRGDGVVISTTEAEKLGFGRARSDSVDSTYSIEAPPPGPENLPPLPGSPKVAPLPGRVVPLSEPLVMAPPPRAPSHLPPLPDSPVLAPSAGVVRPLPPPLNLAPLDIEPPPRTPDNLPPLPDSPTADDGAKKKTPSVGEVLGIAKRGSTSTSLGQGMSQGAGGSPTGSKVSL